MNKLKKMIEKEYANIRIEKGDNRIELEELDLLLDMLDDTTLSDILTDIKTYKKTIV